MHVTRIDLVRSAFLSSSKGFLASFKVCEVFEGIGQLWWFSFDSYNYRSTRAFRCNALRCESKKT